MDYGVYSYSSISKEKKNADGWVYAEKIKPNMFFLVQIKDGKDVLNGWWNGCGWDGLRVDKSKNYKLWKRKKVND